MDGDSYHGPDKWVADLHRLRSLERMGWKFWRCWGSHWRADPDTCLEDLLATLGQMNIEPVGGEFSPFVYTEHRVVDRTEAAAPTEQDISNGEARKPTDEAHAENELVTAERVTEVPTRPPDQSAPPIGRSTSAPSTARFDDIPGLVVGPGDTVIVRFDDNRVRRFRLSTDIHRPEDGVVYINQPIALALLGAGLEEEVEFVVDGKSRTVMIEKISKASELELAD